MKRNTDDICQSCGLPFDENRRHAHEADGSPSPDYCDKCMENGIFCSSNNMQDMIEHTIPHMMANTLGLSEEKAREVLSKELFPNLKRWQDMY